MCTTCACNDTQRSLLITSKTNKFKKKAITPSFNSPNSYTYSIKNRKPNQSTDILLQQNWEILSKNLWSKKKSVHLNLDSIFSIEFHADLIAVDNLGLDGVLNLTLNVTVSWNNSYLRWDEKRKNCDVTTKSCNHFINQTEKYDCDMEFCPSCTG